MGDKARVPLIKMQHKDDSMEIENHQEDIAKMHAENVHEKRAERVANPRNRDPKDPTICPYCSGEAGVGAGEHHGQG